MWTFDHYGRKIPKHSHGTANLSGPTASARLILEEVSDLYDRIVNKKLLVRRINVTANHVKEEGLADKKDTFEQLDLFTDYEAVQKPREDEKAALDTEDRTCTEREAY